MKQERFLELKNNISLFEENDVFSVTELIEYLKKIIKNDSRVGGMIFVKGEVSGLKIKSNLMFFDLVDSETSKYVLGCTVFNLTYRSEEKIPKKVLKDGMTVIVQGQLSLYKKHYSLMVESINLISNRGILLEKIEKLKAKLLANGYFETSRKRSIPSFPKNIGIITSASGAAIHDALKVIGSRYPFVNVYLFPTLVQGENAPKDIAKSISKANKYDLDLILLIRGGGSAEDLMAFNDEKVAKAIFESKIPIVTGIGHQSDNSIADYVADLRFATPTDAAKHCVPDFKELDAILNDKFSYLKKSFENYVERAKRAVEIYGSKIQNNSPINQLVKKEKILNENFLTLKNMVFNYFSSMKSSIENAKPVLQANNPMDYLVQLDGKVDDYYEIINKNSPTEILNMGFAAVFKDKDLITTVEKVNLRDKLKLRLKDGVLLVEVKKIKKLS
jgi:exodeoxyribonuclease VII large subunit